MPNKLNCPNADCNADLTALVEEEAPITDVVEVDCPQCGSALTLMGSPDGPTVELREFDEEEDDDDDEDDEDEDFDDDEDFEDEDEDDDDEG